MTPEEVAAGWRAKAQGRLAFALESGEGFPGYARRSLYGAEPWAVFRSRGRAVRVEVRGRARSLRADPFDALRQFLHAHLPGGRQARTPAAIACLSYDLGRHVERIPSIAVDDLGFPECHLAIYGRIAEVDRATGRAHIHETGPSGWDPDRPHPPAPCAPFSASLLAPNMSRAAYIRAVRRAVRYIRAGDIFQANLSRRFAARITGSILELHDRLRAASPAPFGAWLDMGEGRHVLSTSPERFLRVAGRNVETRPIKGTRPRGRTAAEDGRLKRELEKSEKERAELAMIVDMERNDLGRVCKVGSIRVAEARAIEAYPQVFHGVATVAGRLRADVDHVDLLRATFPGGSISGAPKVRAMEIIEELEPTRRSVYTGAIGWLARDAMDLSIAIRTVLVEGGRATWQAGSGITAESDAEAEERETRAKASGIEKALGIVSR
ncbi:MAG: anthranilate synthase component I family protein [Planctomycetes bacterium]|nr:anthranilate synthase component I family protein [Planctomycetota bacterium]